MITVKEVLERLSIKDESLIASLTTGEGKISDMNEAFEKIWVSWEKAKTSQEIIDPIVNSTLGKFNAVAVQEVNKGLKSMGIELTDEEKAGVTDNGTINTKEYIALANDKISAAVQTVKEQSKANPDIEKVTREWENKYDLLKKDTDQYQTTAKSLQEELETTKENHAKEFQDVNIAMHRGNMMEKMQWSENVTQLTKDGFVAGIDREYAFGWDSEKGSMVMTYQSGEPVFDDKGIDKLTPAQIFEKYALDNKLIKVNNNTPTPQRTTTQVQTQQQQEGGQFVHPNAVSNA